MRHRARSLLASLTSTSTLVNLVSLSALAVAASVVATDEPAHGATPSTAVVADR